MINLDEFLNQPVAHTGNFVFARTSIDKSHEFMKIIDICYFSLLWEWLPQKRYVSGRNDYHFRIRREILHRGIYRVSARKLRKPSLEKILSSNLSKNPGTEIFCSREITETDQMARKFYPECAHGWCVTFPTENRAINQVKSILSTNYGTEIWKFGFSRISVPGYPKSPPDMVLIKFVLSFLKNMNKYHSTPNFRR